MVFNTGNQLTVENILKLLSPVDIFRRYVKYFRIVDVKFRSEFRKDPFPSAIINRYKDTFLYKDFGETGAMNCFQYVSRKFRISFKETLMKINEDFSLELDGTISDREIYIPQETKPVIYHKPKTIIKVKRREFEPHDIQWWEEQSWLVSMLKAAKISPITHYKLTSERRNIYDKLFICDDYSYNMDYYWNDGIFRRKLYFPKKASYRKWTSNTDNTVIQGWDLLPKQGDIVFITSSFKDIGPFWRVFNFPVAIAPNSETSFIPDEVFWKKIQYRFKHKIIYFDNDNSGINKAKEFSQTYGIPYIHNPLRAPKDPSDWWKRDGGRMFGDFLTSKLKTLNFI